MFRRLKIGYYFWQVKRKRMTIDSVAYKLGISKRKVKREYKKYYTVFPHSQSSAGDRVLSVISIIISVYALSFSRDANLLSHEANDIASAANQIEISPDLKIRDKSFSIYWNDTGKLVHVGEEPIGENFYQDAVRIQLPSLMVRNVGRATAKDIVYNWNFEENLQNFRKSFTDLDAEMDYNISIEDNVTEVEIYDSRDGQCDYSFKKDTDSYIASEEEAYLTLPVVYIDLLAKYCFETFPEDDKVDYSRWRVEEEIPSIDLTITYVNVSNKKEEENLSIKFKPVDYHTLDGQAGACMFQLQTETDTQ